MSQNVSKPFQCIKCDYSTSKQFDFDKHTLTRKHLNTYAYLQNKREKSQILYKCDCGKEYLHRQSLYTHKRKCITIDNEIINEYKEEEDTPTQNIIISNAPSSPNDIQQLTSLVIEVVKNNSEFQKQMFEMCRNMQSSIITNCNNTTNNNTFNLQVFLNEYCKDAMNISEFIDSFDLQISDLESVGKLGYIEGMSNIIINKIKELDVSKRPIHCSDLKREIIYIKDDDVWEREDANNSKFRKVIRKVTGKNIGMLTDWRDKYPECMDIESEYNDIYMKLMLSAMGGSDTEGNENKIMKKIAKHVVIDKKMLTN
jgi:hypothetical protein